MHANTSIAGSRHTQLEKKYPRAMWSLGRNDSMLQTAAKIRSLLAAMDNPPPMIHQMGQASQRPPTKSPHMQHHAARATGTRSFPNPLARGVFKLCPVRLEPMAGAETQAIALPLPSHFLQQIRLTNHWKTSSDSYFLCPAHESTSLENGWKTKSTTKSLLQFFGPRTTMLLN